MSEKEEEEPPADGNDSNQQSKELQNEPWAILLEDAESTQSNPEFLKNRVTGLPIHSRVDEKMQKELDEDVGDDPLIKMSRQISSMSKEIETLRISLYNTTELLEQREQELYSLRKKNFVKSNLFTNFVINNDSRRRAFFYWKNHTEQVRKEQEELQDRLKSLVDHHLEESNKNRLVHAQVENEQLQKHLTFAKIFFRWKLSIENYSRNRAERKHMEERLQIMRNLIELREQMTMANDLEAKYVHMALRRGQEMFDGIKEIHEETLITQKWQEEYIRKILSGEVDPKKELESALGGNKKDVTEEADQPPTSSEAEEIQIDLSDGNV